MARSYVDILKVNDESSDDVAVDSGRYEFDTYESLKRWFMTTVYTPPMRPPRREAYSLAQRALLDVSEPVLNDLFNDIRENDREWWGMFAREPSYADFIDVFLRNVRLHKMDAQDPEDEDEHPSTSSKALKDG